MEKKIKILESGLKIILLAVGVCLSFQGKKRSFGFSYTTRKEKKDKFYFINF